ncbi:hypothetical protein D9757_004654 [Collybiopsis confluens]|uniref:Uncharacterized protein n=1 Tax=Collybiopsis confluens TaxID=2823264 RepID=A0A8H5MC43_9AGAR|nr:hypothetical protein D9757_004654 [Collybiopsis confluens]
MIPAKRTSAQLSDSEQSRGRSSRGIGPQDNLPSLVHTTYRKVCQQFDDWSKADFALSMKSLVSAETGSEDRGDIVQQLEHLNLQETEMAHTIPLPLSVVSLDAVLSPLPLYNSCTPISANQFTGDDSSRMSFIPLADDPSFDWEAHCENYKDFAWQTTFFDSDLYSIVFECARRLHQQHGLSYSQIDETGILPLSLTSTENGVLRTTHYQGAFDWADTRSYIRTKHPPSPSVPMLTEFNELVYQFCNSSSCMMGFCDQHIDWSPMPQPFSVAPSSSSNDLFNNIVTPCSTDCFILRVPGNTSNLHPTEWTPNDEDTLDILLRHAPDASPCDLAVINKKSCFEVPYLTEIQCKSFLNLILTSRDIVRKTTSLALILHWLSTANFLATSRGSSTTLQRISTAELKLSWFTATTESEYTPVDNFIII